MKMEIEAKILLQIPNPKLGETQDDFVLAVEQFMNKNSLLIMPPADSRPAKEGTHVGIRVHCNDWKVT